MGANEENRSTPHRVRRDRPHVVRWLSTRASSAGEAGPRVLPGGRARGKAGSFFHGAGLRGAARAGGGNRFRPGHSPSSWHKLDRRVFAPRVRRPARTRMAWRSPATARASPVDTLPVAHRDYGDRAFAEADVGDHPVVPDAHPPNLLTGEHHEGPHRVASRGLDLAQDPHLQGAWERLKVLSRAVRPREREVAQSPSSFRSCLVV